MCGIVGYCGPRSAGPILLDALGRLEYRGYDSAGLALLTREGLFLERRAGKLRNLRAALAEITPRAHTGIAHTRWATHGAPTDANAHPHRDCSGRLVVVHNGIIENYATLRDELTARGHTFRSETDSETIAHLLEEAYQGDLRAALLAVLPRLEGAFALLVAHADEPGRLLGTRAHAPLVAGSSADEGFLASDPLALAGIATQVVYLAEGDVVDLHADRIEVCDRDGHPLVRPSEPLDLDPATADKGGHAHAMRKELFEQPESLRAALAGRIREGQVELPELVALEGAIRGAARIELVACGSAFYAAQITARLIERWSGLPTRSTVASEFRYEAPRLGPETLVIAISQSGETADTLAATRLAVSAGSPVIALVNAAGSSLAREANATVLLQAGPEIAVAATKSFTAQATVGVLLALRIAQLRGTIDAADQARIIAGLSALPGQAALAIEWSEDACAIAARLRDVAGFLYLGRGAGLPAAMEGALKMKEISYIHADGYPAGELKHGPIALLEPDRPIIAVATASATRAKLITNLMEGRARGAEVIAVVERGSSALAGIAEAILWVPPCEEELSPILAVIPLQRLAYEHAVARGLDVDQPRNLAKSVTVE